MFMSTRYKKRDPEWKKRPLFAVEDSLAKLLNCLSIEYSVSKLISPKYKNFRCQKVKFESKTRINNAIWRAWHIQYKNNKRPRFCQFAPPFSDKTVHSTPQAVILEGKTWKRRLDIVSRKYKKWRKFYNYKILKGESAGEESDTLKELSNENSEDEFQSEEEEDTDGNKLRLSPNKNSEQKNGAQNQVFFKSPEFMMDTFVADLPDTLFSSIRPVKANEIDLGFQFTDLSDMIQPTLDQLNPCFDELFEDFNFITGTRTLDTVEEQPPDTSLDGMMNLQSDSNHMQQGLLDERMYTDPLDTASAYLYSSQFLLTSSSSVVSPRHSSTDVGIKAFVSNCSQHQTAETGKRQASKECADITGDSPPRKILIKDTMDVDDFQPSLYPNTSIHPDFTAHSSNRGESKKFKASFETILANTVASSDVTRPTSTFEVPFNSQSKTDTFIPTSSRSVVPSNVTPDTNIDIKSPSESTVHKFLANQNPRSVEYSDLPPQLQAPNLTAHLQAVMSARPKPPSKIGAIPRNKSDTHLASLAKAEKASAPASQSAGLQSTSMRRDSAPSVPARLKRASKMPRNMSDTSLVQLAKDSTKRPSRRRQSSVSVDTRPLILPKNLSESNLCALAMGTAKRPQPILPKNLVAIAKSGQSKAVGILPKTSIAPVNIAVSEANASSGQFSNFLVNKQQPCNAEPVQVKLYMPKTKQATANFSSTNIKTASSVGATATTVLPQRVEVIQYQGSNQVNIPVRQNNDIIITNTLEQNQSKISALQNQSAVGLDIHGSAFQKLTQSQSMGAIQGIASNRIAYVSPSSVSVTMRPNASVLNSSTNSLIRTCNVESSVSQMHGNGNAALGNSVPVTSDVTDSLSTAQKTDEAKQVSVAPLQGLSEQQLVTLAQVLQGAGSGSIGQGNTIAYLEMLQQQLNSLLLQQQAMLKSQQSDASISQPSSSIQQHKNVQQQQHLQQQQQQQIDVQQLKQPQQQLNMQPRQQQLNTQQQQQLGEQQLKQPQQQLNMQPQQQQLNTQQLQQLGKQQLKQQQQQLNTQPQQQVSMQRVQQQQFNIQQLQHGQIPSIINNQQQQQSQPNASLTAQSQRSIQYVQIVNSDNETQLQQTQSSEQQQTTSEQMLNNPVSTYLSSITQHLMQQQQQQQLNKTDYSSVNASPQLKDAPVNVMLQRQNVPSTEFIKASDTSQPHDIPLRHSRQTSVSSYHQQFVNSQANTRQLSTVDTAVINLTSQINKPSSQLTAQLPTHSSNLNTIQSIIIKPEGVVTLSASQAKSSGDGTTRPTMVDLALAASQRSYLTSPSSLYHDTPIESFSGSRGQTTTAPSTSTTATPLPIPTVIISDLESSSSNLSDASSGKRPKVRFENRDSYKEYRRRNHVSAEQRRRGLIKVAFDQMISLIPSLQADKQGRTSKALVLQKGAEYIEQLQTEQEITKSKAEKLRMEVHRLNNEIKICQQQLPACGAISSQDNVKNIETSFLQHIRERITQDQKYWIFAVMIRPLFQSFQETVIVRTLQEFIQSVLQWFDDYCGLPRLRPVVISTLTQFSTNTAILSDPSSFPSQALEATGRVDPTVFGQPAETTVSNPEPLQQIMRQVQQVPAQQQNQESVILPGQSISWMLQPTMNRK